VFGAEEVVNGDFSNGTANWIAVQSTLASVGGELVVTSADQNPGSKKAQQTVTGLVIGKQYSATGTGRRGSSTSAARILLEDDELGFPIIVNNNTTIKQTRTIFFTAVSTSVVIQADIGSSSATGTCIFDNVSIKEITNIVEYKNIPQTARELYTLEDDTWVGSNELVVNGDFTTDSDWVSINDSSGAWSISNDSANVNCTSNAIFKNLGEVIKTGTFYLVSYELKNYVSGSVRLKLGSAAGTFQSANGIYSQIIEGIASSSNISFEANFSQGFDGSIDNVSIVEIIEVADFIEPVTQGMTLTEAWTTRGTAYSTLQNTTSASVRVDATISNTDNGVLMESGGAGKGVVLYVYSGVLYFQCGKGDAYGTASDRAEVSYTLPVAGADYIIEWSADTFNAVLYVNGLVVGSQAFSSTYLAGNDPGTVGEVKADVSVNRGGWTTDGSGVYTNTITKTSDV
jgi:hypothetical protein